MSRGVDKGERKILIPRTVPSFQFATYDIETHGLAAKRLKFVGFYMPAFGYRWFRTADEFWAFVKNEVPAKTYLYAYNAEYDLSGLVDNYLYDMDEVIVNGGRFIQGERFGKTFPDAMNLFLAGDKRNAFSAIAKQFGFEKLEIPESFTDDAQFTESISQEELVYNENDVVVLYNSLDKFFEFVGSYVGPAPLTLASNSIRVWEHCFSGDLPETSAKGRVIRVSELDGYARAAYYGGRTEMFCKGRLEGLICWDVHSMYPAVMQSGRFPHPGELVHRYGHELSVREWDGVLRDCEGMATGVAHVPESLYYGVLPMLDLEDEEPKTLFPVGTFRGHWCFPEIRALLAHGGTFWPEETVFSRITVQPFADFMGSLYEIRRSSPNPTWKFIVKILMNSLYGKFGQSGLDQEKYRRLKGKTPGCDCTKIECDANHWKWKPLSHSKPEEAGVWTLEATDDFSYHTIVFFAAYTTSLARTKLLEGLVRSQGVYCDTDSVFSTIFPEDLKHPDQLGLWGADKRTEWCEFYAPKMYQCKIIDTTLPEGHSGPQLPLTQKCKGVPRRHTSEAFVALSAGLAYEVSYSRLTKSKESIRRKLPPQMPMEVTKTLTAADSKRRWNPDGSSLPHVYSWDGEKNIHVCCKEGKRKRQ